MTGPWSDDRIDTVARQFENRTLPKSEWTHGAHFAVALSILRQRGDRAWRDLPGLIRAYNEATGVANTDTGGYHETITVASLRAADAWCRDRPGVALSGILTELLATPLGRSDWLLQYWSRPVLFSPLARATWLDPDLNPLPY